MNDIEILVIDEADRMLELEFSAELTEIVRACPRGRQTMLFSATLSDNVQSLVDLSLNNPVRIVIDPYESIVDRLVQEFIRIRPQYDNQLERESIIISLVKRVYKSKTIIFCNQKVQCHRLAIIFNLLNLRASELHGNLPQSTRLQAIQDFKDGRVDFLLCTDVAARGIDIKNVQTVINMNLPVQLKSYVHRVGRTARAGSSGRSCSLVSENERSMLKLIIRKASDVVISRTVNRDNIDKYKNIIVDLEQDIHNILQDEYNEKELRLAEMEQNKAKNMILHKDEIKSKPQKTWILSNKQKQDIKQKSERIVSGSNKQNENDMTQEEIWALERKKKYSRDKYAGLSRDKRRRLQAKEQIEKELKQQARDRYKQQTENNGQGYTYNSKQEQDIVNKVKHIDIASNAAKAAKRQLRDNNNDHDDDNTYKKPKLSDKQIEQKRKQRAQQAILANRYTDDQYNKVDSRFTSAQKYAERTDKRNDERFKKQISKQGKAHHSFKSKSRFKRR